MPIYCQYPVESNRITYENFMNLDRLPTTSCCFRVDHASIDDDGLFIKMDDPDPQIAAMAFYAAQPYETAGYSTAYYLSTIKERDMF